MYEMKSEYFTGIEMIDNEHAQLFGYAEEIYQLLQDEFLYDKYDEIVSVLSKLRDYTAEHFADEEAYMESIQYKRLFTQKIQHQSFVDKLKQIDLDEISVSDNQNETIMELLEFLTNWLIHHILEVDMLIGR